MDTETRNKGGRPLKFKTVAALRKGIDAYFKECEEKEEPYTITGLALSLDTTRETLCDYEKREGYSYTVKRAKLRCENYAEKQLLRGGNAAGAIFALKNYGWTDKQTRELTGPDGGPIEQGVKYTDFPPEPKTIAEWEQQVEEARAAREKE